jgi:hypothetical protein
MNIQKMRGESIKSKELPSTVKNIQDIQGLDLSPRLDKTAVAIFTSSTI